MRFLTDYASVRVLLGVALGLGIAACATGGPPVQSAPASPSPGPEPVAEPVTEPVASPVAESVAEPVAEPPQINWETKDSGVQVPDDWRACSAPEDCELVVTTCCDQCNGGKAVSVAKSHVADARAKFKPMGCGACTKRGCSTRAFCDNGRCVLQWQSMR